MGGSLALRPLPLRGAFPLATLAKTANAATLCPSFGLFVLRALVLFVYWDLLHVSSGGLGPLSVLLLLE